MSQPSPSKNANTRRNDRVVLFCAGGVAAMLALTYASVPLYRLFCQATGYDGTTRVAAAAPGAVGERAFIVRFDANVSDLPWRFAPLTRQVTVKMGEDRLAHFTAENLSSQETVGTATFNVTPEIVGRYFNKIACFCFSEQPLGPGQVADLPVSFFIDPKIADDPDLKGISEITLSYTFFPVTRDEPARAGGQQASLTSTNKLGAQ